MLSSQQPPTQISRHAQLLEIFIEVDERGAAVDSDGDGDVDIYYDEVSVYVLRKMITIDRKIKAPIKVGGHWI